MAVKRGQMVVALFAHIETWRPYTAFYVGLVGLAGIGAIRTDATAAQQFAAWSVPTLAWLAGLYGGDYFDRNLDAEAKPHRPIPSGRISSKTALGCFLGCVAVGAIIAFTANWRTIFIVVAALLLGVSYNTFFKGRGISGNFVRGSLTALAFCYGTMMVAPFPPIFTAPILLVFWAHDTASNLIGTVRDTDGDRNGGYRTLAVKHGSRRATLVAGGFLLVSYSLLLLLPTLLARPSTVGLMVGISVAVASAAWTLRPLLAATDIRQAAYQAHEVFVLSRIVVAGSLLTWDYGIAIGALVTGLALIVSWASQRVLRRRHEFADTTTIPVPTAAEVIDFVDRQLETLSENPELLNGLSNWNRIITITLKEPNTRLRLVTEDGTLRRPGVEEPDTEAPNIQIATSGAVFRDIFQTGRSNPRHAYLSGDLTMDSPAADMMRLNQLFNHFRSIARSSGQPVTSMPRQEAPTRPDLTTTGRVVISDTTLRDGEQMPGVMFSREHKRELARRLAAARVPLIEAGFPAVSEEERGALRDIVEDADEAVVQVIARPIERDIDAALETGAPSVAVFIGTSDLHLTKKLRMTTDQALGAVDYAVKRAKRAGRQVVFAAEDATRTDEGELSRFCRAAAEAGADTLGVADTVGIANPWSMFTLVRNLITECPLPVAVHCHNDLGLASANSVAGVLAGASGVQCSALGIGERAGNAPLEQVVMALSTAVNVDSGIDRTALHSLAEYVSELVDIPTPEYQPVVGRNAFTHESGLHLDGINQDPRAYEPYDPALTGRERRIVLGKHSGMSAVQAYARAEGIELNQQRAREILALVKSSPGLARNAPTDVRDMIRQLAGDEMSPIRVQANKRF